MVQPEMVDRTWIACGGYCCVSTHIRYIEPNWSLVAGAGADRPVLMKAHIELSGNVNQAIESFLPVSSAWKVSSPRPRRSGLSCAEGEKLLRR